MDELLERIEILYSRLCRCTVTSARAYNGKMIIAIIKEYPQITEHWQYHPEAYAWEDRFVRVGDICTKPKATPVFHDNSTNLRLAPNESGLYFFGNTAYNPHTGEVQYWVKVGVSSDIYERARAYRTCNPSTYVIGYQLESHYRYTLENEYHRIINRLALYRNQNSDEWWMVDRETYLTMCEKGFDFFEITP